MPKQNEAQYITERLVKTYGLWFRVTKKIATPDFWVYMLARRSDQKVGDLHTVADALADDIYALRNDGKPVKVTVITQPPHIQVSRSQRAILPWAANEAQVRPFVAVLGAFWRGPEPQKMIIDFRDDDFSVGAFFGSQGSGKSTLLHIALLGLCRSTSPELVEIYGIDFKKGSFAIYEQLPHVRFTAQNEADAMDLLRWIESLCYADNAPNDGKIRVLFIDELQMLIADSQYAREYLDLIRSIMQLGREFGIRLLSATQNPSAINYPSNLKPLTPYMAAGKTKVDGYLRSQLKIIGARDLRGKGDFIFDGPESKQRFKSFWLGDAEREAEIAKLITKWGADAEVIHFIPAEEEHPHLPHDEIDASEYTEQHTEEYAAQHIPEEAEEYLETHRPTGEQRKAQPPIDASESATVATPPRKLGKAERKLQADADAIAHLMTEAWDDEYEEIRNGYGVLLIAAIYGEEKPNAGNYKRRMMDAVNHYLLTTEPNEPNEPNEPTQNDEELVWMLPYEGN